MYITDTKLITLPCSLVRTGNNRERIRKDYNSESDTLILKKLGMH